MWMIARDQHINRFIFHRKKKYVIEKKIPIPLFENGCMQERERGGSNDCIRYNFFPAAFLSANS